MFFDIRTDWGGRRESSKMDQEPGEENRMRDSQIVFVSGFRSVLIFRPEEAHDEVCVCVCVCVCVWVCVNCVCVGVCVCPAKERNYLLIRKLSLFWYLERKVSKGNRHGEKWTELLLQSQIGSKYKKEKWIHLLIHPSVRLSFGKNQNCSLLQRRKEPNRKERKGEQTRFDRLTGQREEDERKKDEKEGNEKQQMYEEHQKLQT